ncbi:MAG: hypothetical protein EXS58_03240 [Candidatus Latescibacteria bacterium]|nr:hypothetical protein [Candidatus Latescibacterota bacterium]
MGIFTFLTASRLRTEITRQRDEIARLHQLIDLEGAHRKEAEKFSEERGRRNQELQHENRELQIQLKAQEATFHEKSAQLKEKLESESQRLREQTTTKERDMDVRVATLRQELEEKQRQRSEGTEHSAGWPKRSPSSKRPSMSLKPRCSCARVVLPNWKPKPRNSSAISPASWAT